MALMYSGRVSGKLSNESHGPGVGGIGSIDAAMRSGVPGFENRAAALRVLNEVYHDRRNTRRSTQIPGERRS
jgi:hypothetical protein